MSLTLCTIHFDLIVKSRNNYCAYKSISLLRAITLSL